MEARIDKWLWAARIYKTRTLAGNACKNSRVTVNGQYSKSSKLIKEGDIIEVKKPPIVYRYKVLDPIEKRVGAKLVSSILEDITDPSQYEIIETIKMTGYVGRAKGTGRPTKKDRRALDEFFEVYE